MKCLEPFNLENAKIVILDAFPGEVSLYIKKYYYDLYEQFWQLLGITATDYEERLKVLQEKGIGLWSVVASCIRTPSKSFKSVKYNKFNALQGKTIFFNGARAYKNFLIATEKSKINFNVSEKNILTSSNSIVPIKEESQQQWRDIIRIYK